RIDEDNLHIRTLPPPAHPIPLYSRERLNLVQSIEGLRVDNAIYKTWENVAFAWFDAASVMERALHGRHSPPTDAIPPSDETLPTVL
ncbi:hypothetical protein BHM03_00055457, partial [Ensete ventricosum]